MYLIIGGNSEIGAAAGRTLAESGARVMATTRRPTGRGDGQITLDFAAPLGGWTPPPETQAACIFVAVARLAACQADPTASALINCTRTIELADRLAGAGVYTLFLSTNQVFDGRDAQKPADAPASPVSEYGRQKALTEAALKERMAKGAAMGILRLAKVVSPGMALLCDWRRELSAGRSIRAFTDMTMAPTPVGLVSRAIALMLRDREPVIAQLTGARDVAYADIGRFIARRVGADERLVEPVSALANGMPPGATPANTTLDSSYLRDRYGLAVPDAFDVLAGSIASHRHSKA